MRAYGLSLRMLWSREDAEDATQEILVRIVTRLWQFDFRSRLKTWASRVAVNFILDVNQPSPASIVVSIATAGDLLQWHPHRHLFTTDGGRGAFGSWHTPGE